MGGVFDPLALDNPSVKIGDDVYTLGDITSSRQKVLQEVSQRITDLETSAEDDDTAAVRAIADLVEAACVDAKGLSDRIVKLYEDDVIGRKGLHGLTEFVGEWLGGGISGEASSPTQPTS